MIASRYNIVVPINEKKYVFNLASQCLIEANSDLVSYLNGERNDLDLTVEEQQELYNNGIIADSHEFELARLKSNVNSLKFDRSRFGIFLSTTSGCNLNCTYCYQDKRKELNTKDYITPETWEVMLKHFKAEIKQHHVKHFSVFLFGGEPMNNDTMCQQIVKDLKKLEAEIEDLKVQLVLITNGTLFTEENIDFYLKNVNTLQITLDGLKEINDQFRIYPDGSGSFDKIIEGLHLIKKHNLGNDTSEVCLRVNVNDDTVEKAKELIDFIFDNELHEGITAISFHEIFDTQGSVIEAGGDCERKNIELAKKICQLNFYVISKGGRVFRELSGPCIAKMATGYAIDEDLNIYGCPGIIYSEVHGKLQENGGILIQDKRWYDYYLDDPSCINVCKYAPICYGGCTWARGNKENDCMKDIYNATIVPKLQTYIMSKYA